jgi:multicomponent Na+:H+ antiporter subunit D
MIVVSSLLAAVYVWRFVEVAYFRAPRGDTANVVATPWLMSVPTAVLVIATVYFGLDTSFTIGTASDAAAALLGGQR